jgi:hypothetical protein
MNASKAIPQTVEAAERAGYKRFEELPRKVQTAILAHDKAQVEMFAAVAGVCGPGHSGPCSTTNYPDGTQKVCFCNAANQCDECRFQPAGTT